MGKDIISLFPEAMDALDIAGRAFALEQDNPDKPSLSRCMYPLPGHILDRKTADAILRSTDVAQPAIGTISLAMTRVLSRFNIRPETACGHSFGELTALWAAGWMDEATFCELAAARGRCMALPNDDKEAGTMLAVKAPLADIEKLLANEHLDLVLANRNSHDQGVLSGTAAAIEQAAQACRKLKLRAVRLPVAAAFHSPLVHHAAEPFQKRLLDRTIIPTRVPVYANTTGHPYPLDPKEIKDLLGNQLLNPVNFVKAMEAMADDGTAVFVEVGPKTVLSGLAGSILKQRPCTVIAMDASGGKKSGLSDLANVLCTLASLGYPVDLTQWEDPCQKPEARKMRVPITGANIRHKQDISQSAPLKKNETHQDPKPEIKTEPLASPRETQTINSTPANTDDKQETLEGYDMTSCHHQTSRASAPAHSRNTGVQGPTSQSQSMIFEAMKMVQKGLDSMTALQAQTARTHEKFLETQALASQTLQAMMDQTRQMIQRITQPQPNGARPVYPAAPDPVSTASPGASPTGLPAGNGALATAAAASQGNPLQNPPSKKAAPEVHPAPAPEVQHNRDNPEAPPVVSQRIQTLVLDTVSRLTGFPMEMLELDMDVESDLGIDSIKRVEIVSELERALPDVTTLTPDTLGTLRTLRDICKALGQSDPIEATDKSGPCQGNPLTVKTLVPASDSAGPGPESFQEIQRLVLETVSRLTGFPVEMLELDMDVESDLGIDSIKRVEIVSELERALPDVTTLTPDALGTLRTLKDICGALCPAHQPQKSDPLPGDDRNIPLAVRPFEATRSKGIMTLLVTTISDLTGFPMEMLEPDMDLESDLGIDSIKRVEILSRLEQDLPEAGTITPDDMALLRTLGQIAARLETLQATPATAAPDQASEAVDSSRESGTQTRQSDVQENTKSLLRQVVSLKPYAIDHVRFHNGSRINLPANRRVYITRDGSGMAEAMGRAFSASGIDASIIDMDNGLSREIHDAGGLVIIADQDRVKDCDSGMMFLRSAFAMAKKFAPFLLASASEKGGFLTTVSFLGGTFGFGDTPVQNPVQGGLAGLTKTAALEWDAVLCRSLDLPASDTDALGYAEAAAALCMINGPVEMGIRDNECLIPELVAAPVSPQTSPKLKSNDVIVITGGAKGVTARCALELARAGSKAIALLGRSEPPFLEPGWMQDLTSEQDMKKAILTNGFDHRPTPAEVEDMYRKFMSNREISLTLEGIREAGSKVQYFSVDVRDEQQVLKTVNQVRTAFNSITGVIHGAGVLEDRLIADKTLDQWTRVMDTKVKGLKALDRATLKDSLKFFAIFSSVAARTGNKGQADYATANEVMNKTARKMAGQRPGCRVVSINWGPWEGGMVNASLKKEFIRQGIDLIPLDEGARSLVAELSDQEARDTEVVIGASLLKSKKIKPQLAEQPEKKPGLKRAFTTVAGIAACPVLKSHTIAGEPVVPFALMVEWFGHGAEHANPGLVFSGLDDMRLLKGIKPGKGEAGIDVFTGKCRPAKGGFALDSEIRSHFSGSETQFLNTSATVLLKEKLPSPPVHTLPDPNPMKPFSMSVNRAYDTILFHGKDLRGIKAITGYSANGIEVVSARAPLPKAWLASSHRKHWVFDPLVMDSAFQAAILWCSETTGAACLPSYMANLRCYASHSGYTGDVRIILTVNETTERVIKGYFTFLDQAGTVLASITGFEAVRDPSLALKFNTAAPSEQAPGKTPEVLFPREKILAFASGNPSEAFGAPYRIFNRQRKIARLPRPPYFFMDRVIKADAPPWEMKPGGWIEAQFDLPENGWYFRANRSESLPYCILLEVALQPCGWLAAYAGSALKSADRLFFRNLGGDATVLRTVRKDTGTLTMRSRMSRVSEAGGFIIQDFDMEVLDRNGLVYKGTTNFGFFTEKALSKQTGIRNSPLTNHSLSDRDREQAKSLDYSDDPPMTPDDTAEGPNSGMPSKALRMIDRIDFMVPDAGHYGKGFIQGTKHVDPEEWFFHAHFYQDPVCPGSLGIESFLQLLRAFALDRWEYDPDHLCLDLTQGRSHQWMYRGQIVPSNSRILVQAHIRETDDDNHTLAADGTLSVDGLCIYQMENMHLSLVPAHGKVKSKTRGNLKKASR
ncbi:MAG: SDR family oxidoreductase [Pseudomonadota bacterium]